MTDAQNAKWPDGVRSVSHDDIGALGVDQGGRLYWHGKPVVTRSRLNLSGWQTLAAIMVAVGIAIGGLGAGVLGWTAYNDWACKIGWVAVCPPRDVQRPVQPNNADISAYGAGHPAT